MDTTNRSRFKAFTVLVLPLLLLVPSVSFAATLSVTQVNAILQLLVAFNVDSTTLLAVENVLEPTAQGAQQNTSANGSSSGPLDVSRKPGETDAEYNARMAAFNRSLVSPIATTQPTTPPTTGPGSLDPTLNNPPNTESIPVSSGPQPSLQQIADAVAQKEEADSQAALNAYLAKRQQAEQQIRQEVSATGGIVTESQIQEEIAAKLQQMGLSVPPSAATFTGPMTCSQNQLQYLSLLNGEPATYRCADANGLTTNVTVSPDGSLQMSTY